MRAIGLRPLLGWWQVSDGQSVLMKGRTIAFILIVLRGAVSHGSRRHVPGDFLGCANAVSGLPVLDDAVSSLPAARVTPPRLAQPQTFRLFP